MQIPIFPLNTVLFPGGVLPLRVFEARYMDMTRECMRKGAPFGVCLIREGREVGAAAVPHTIGCLANIADWDMQQLGLLQLRTVGGSRFRILSQQIAGNGLITAEVELLADEAPALPQSQHSVCVEVLRGIVTLLTIWAPNAMELLSPMREMVFGALIIAFLIFEPHGLVEMWRRIRRFFHLWPFKT